MGYNDHINPVISRILAVLGELKTAGDLKEVYDGPGDIPPKIPFTALLGFRDEAERISSAGVDTHRFIFSVELVNENVDGATMRTLIGKVHDKLEADEDLNGTVRDAHVRLVDYIVADIKGRQLHSCVLELEGLKEF